MTVEKDTVILHMFDRARTSPNPSPFPLKLETFLRIAKIKYEPDFKKPKSSKGKSPWITLNGVDVADSQISIEYMIKHFGESADLSRHLSPKEKAEAKGIRCIMEDNFYYTMAMYRMTIGKKSDVLKVMAPLPGPAFLHEFFLGQFGKGIIKQCQAQGIGRHTPEEIIRIGKEDIRAVSDFLGNDKLFMMGDKPTETDCVVFGFTTQLLYGSPDEPDAPFKKLIEEECVNLKAHHDRIKEQFWPDWEDCKWKPKE